MASFGKNVVSGADSSSSSSSSGDPGNISHFPWNIATQLYVNLTTKNKSAVTFRVRVGDWRMGNPQSTSSILLGTYDFTGKIASLSYDSEHFGSMTDQFDPVVTTLGGTLQTVDFAGDQTGYGTEYQITISGSNLSVVMGFYIWASDGASGEGLSFDAGNKAYFDNNPDTTCFIQVGNDSYTTYQGTVNSGTQLVYLPWHSSPKASE